MKIIFSILFLISTLTITKDVMVQRQAVIVLVEPVGETFTEEEKQTVYQNILTSIAYWRDLAPIKTDVTIISTQFITTEYDVLNDPGLLIQTANVQVKVGNLAIFVIDNNNAGRYIFGNSWGIAESAAIYIVSNAGPWTYAHEFGHTLYDLPHQYQAGLDIMGLDPYPAWQQHTIGCASLAVMGKPCVKIYLPRVRV